MSFADFPEQQQVVQLLQRSLDRGRLGHAYLFTGGDSDELEAMAQTLAKTLNCHQPRKSDSGNALDSCDRCSSCLRVGEMLHPDVHRVRPESKLRIITIDQMRDLMEEVHLKPTEAVFKVAIIVGADIVELNPTRDINGMTAMVAAKFFKELLVKLLPTASV